MTILRYERNKIAKRDHSQQCDMTGVPVEKGDRYFTGCFVDGGQFDHIKAHGIIHDLAEWHLDRGDLYETWDPSEAYEYLKGWLLFQFGEDETWVDYKPGVKRYGWIVSEELLDILDAAVEYWRSARGVD